MFELQLPALLREACATAIRASGNGLGSSGQVPKPAETGPHCKTGSPWV